MTQTCNVCFERLGAPVYQSADNASITTMNKVIPGRTEVFFCGHCSHLQTTELPNIEQYYASEYEINLDNEEDDQLYKMVDGRPVYRADHQASVLMDKVSFPDGARVLDYGCAKAATLRKVLARRPGIVPLVFDVTDKYIPFWNKFVADGNWATFRPRPEWEGTIDVLLSFYALEHVRDLGKALKDVHSLLKPGGTFYFIVPNAHRNIADFVVADHINHFSAPSLRVMLARAGFEPLEVDEQVHESAFVIRARKARPSDRNLPDAGAVQAIGGGIAEIAAFWKGAAERIRTFEGNLAPGVRRAIYGAGFYGNFIASSLRNPEKIDCFVDQNRHLQGRKIRDTPVVGPDALPEGTGAVFVGLNPQFAREVMNGIEAWRGRDHRYFFL